MDRGNVIWIKGLDSVWTFLCWLPGLVYTCKQQARPYIGVLHFLAWALLVLFPSIWPICPFSFCCSWTRCASLDFSEREEEERASRHSFWDCRRAAFFATSPHPCSSAWWWARQKRLKQKSHCKLMSDRLSLHLMKRGRREGGNRKTYSSTMSLHIKQYIRSWMEETCTVTAV